MNDFEIACSNCRKKWLSMKELSISSFPKIKEEKQKENESCIDEVLHGLRSHKNNTNFDELDTLMKNWFQRDEIWNLSWLTTDERDDFYHISKEFMKDARKFDKNLSMEDIGQAMRNVWIILILEKVFERPLKYHKAIFAYSMLYPYTDNFLDDEHVDRKDKHIFNLWLSERLKGTTLECANQNYRKVHALVDMIEEVYPRKEFPKVYEALLYIQNGQKKSLLQYDVHDYVTLLDISIEKGGASVLADGYLIDGTLHEQEVTFCVEFGFLLQIADDIQDIHQDHQQGYHTLVGIQKGKKECVAMCNQYFRYVQEVIHETCHSNNHKLKIFIEENCRLLIFFSLLSNAKYYTKIFLFQVKTRIPIRVSFLENIKEQFQDKAFEKEFMMQRFDAFLQKES